MGTNRNSDSKKTKNKDVKNNTSSKSKNKKTISSKKGTKKKKVNNKGFTLVELLATIAVLAIIITITLSIGLGVIKKSKEKSYQVTIENIENVASSYLSENSNKLFFVDTGGNNLEYQCVTVQNLIDFGYFDEDITESFVENNVNVKVSDYIYLSRDKTTKTLVKSRYVGEKDTSDYTTLCGSSLSSLGDIRFSVYPSGWSKTKTITISYNLKNYSDISKYKNSYQYELQDGTLDKNSGDKNFTQKDTIEIDKNGTLTAEIKKVSNQSDDDWKDIKSTLTISKIDNDKPLVSIDYSGDTVVKQKVTIPIVITDKTSGIDKEEIELTKNIRVFVGDTEVFVDGDSTKEATMEFKCVSCTEHDKEWKYNLEITNYYDDGDIRIEIDDDVFYDQANNANDEVVLEPGIEFSNVYTINFDANGGSPSKTLEKKYGNTLGTLPTATYPGYKFKGWSETKTTAGNECSSYIDANTVVKTDKTYYACWEANVLTIKYSVNGGLIKEETASSSGTIYAWTTDSSGVIEKNGSVLTQTIEYGKTLKSSGLVNYDNEGYIYISKKGYTPPSGQEWKCLSGGCVKDKTYSHAKVYKDSDFCDLTKGDCEVILGVNWKANTYNVSYNSGSCVSATNSATATYDQVFTIIKKSSVSVTTGYTFNGWTTNSDGTNDGYNWTDWSGTWTYIDGQYGISDGELQLYPMCSINKIHIKYNMNGGSFVENTTNKANGISYSGSSITRNGSLIYESKDYGTTGINLANPDNSAYINIAKTGYAPVTGAEWKKSDGTTFSDSGGVDSAKLCDASKGDCTVELFVNWKANTYNVTYNSGSCVSTTNSVMATYNQSFTIIKKSSVSVISGYTFSGWTTNEDGTDDNYGWTDWSGTWKYINGQYGISDGELQLYPMCSINKINVKFNMNGGTFGSTTSSTISYSGSNITRNGSLIVADYDYGTTGIDLANPDNSGYINIVKTGYTPASGAEWKKSDGTTFSDSGGVDSAKLCDASKGDCTVELFVNWKINTYTITYDANGGTVSTSTVSKNYGDTLGTLPTPTYTGYTFKGWSATKTTPGSTCSSYISSSTKVTANKTYYACWSKNVLTIKYSVNGGTIQASTVSSGTTYSWTTDSSGLIYRNGTLHTQTLDYGESMGTYGLANYDNSTWINISRSGYFASTDKEWICLSGECKSKVYHQDKAYAASDFCDLSKSSCEVIIGVNWISDSTKPTCSISVSGVDYPDSVYTSSGVTWYNEDISLNLSYNDNYEVKEFGLTRETTATYNNLSVRTVSDVTSSSGETWYGYVMDKAGNEGVCSIKIGITDNPNAYSVQYNTNSCVDVTKTSQTAIYGQTFTTLTGSDVTAKAGYKFNGWTTNSNGTDDGYGWTGFSGTWTYTDGQKGISNQTLKLYARCEKYKVNVKINMNGGTFVETTTNKANGVGVSGNYVTRNGNLIYETHYYGDTDVNLTDPDNSSYVNIVKTGYAPLTGAEWKKSNGTTFSDSGGVNANDLCDASSGDCTVELFVNWKVNTYTITYDANGGTSSTSTVSRDYGTTLGTLPTASSIGFKFKGWSETKTTPGTTCSSYISSSTTVTGDKTYYACWEYNKINVMFNMNGGTFVETTTNKANGISYSGSYITKNGSTTYITYNYGTTNIDLANPDNSSYINISRTGYAPVTGAEWKKSDGTTFSASGGVNSANLCDASSDDCTVVLYVNWKVKPLYVFYNVNNGNIKSTTTENGVTYGWDTSSTGTILDPDDPIYSYFTVNSSANLYDYNSSGFMNITYSGYIAKSNSEWNTKADGTGVSFSQDTVYSYDDFLDYATEESNKYTLELYVNWMKLSDVILISSSDIAIDDGSTFETEYGDPSTDGSIVDDDLSKQYNVTLPLDMDYIFQVWGAQGGRSEYSSSGSSARGGYGGFSTGTYAGTANSTIYVNVGGRGYYNSCSGWSSCSYSSGGYNGGGDTYLYYGATVAAGGGGGATHIATSSGVLSALNDDDDISDVLIVAGGGGGGARAYNADFSDCACDYDYCSRVGGEGGGYDADNGSGSCYGYGGGQSSTKWNNCYSYISYAYSEYTQFGYGRTTVYNTDGYYYGGGGGGGYYGGGGGWGTQNIPGGGGGGSGYINTSVLTDAYMAGYGVTTSDDTATKTISVSNVSVAPTVDYAKMNNGYARVTVSNGQGGYYTNGFNYKKNSSTETTYTIISSEITASNLTTYLKCDDSNATISNITSSDNTLTFTIVSPTDTVCRIYK